MDQLRDPLVLPNGLTVDNREVLIDALQHVWQIFGRLCLLPPLSLGLGTSPGRSHGLLDIWLRRIKKIFASELVGNEVASGIARYSALKLFRLVQTVGEVRVMRHFSLLIKLG